MKHEDQESGRSFEKLRDVEGVVAEVEKVRINVQSCQTHEKWWWRGKKRKE